MASFIAKTYGVLALGAVMLIGASAVAPQSALASYGRTTEARVYTDLNLRYGPSTDYYVILTIPRHAYVDILRCQPRRNWCEVRYRHYTGWVAARYLYHPRYDRSYDRWYDRDRVSSFDYFAHIGDWDYDRGRRYRHCRWGDDYYRGLRQGGYRHHEGWRQRSHRRHGRGSYYYDD